jgi:hypothetical protein
MSSIVKQYPKFKDIVSVVEPDNIKASPCLAGALIQGVIQSDPTETKVKMHQNIILIPSTLVNLKRYTALVGYNPELDSYGHVSCQPLLFKGESPYLVFKAKKDMDLSSLDYIFRMVVID